MIAAVALHAGLGEIPAAVQRGVGQEGAGTLVSCRRDEEKASRGLRSLLLVLRIVHDEGIPLNALQERKPSL